MDDEEETDVHLSECGIDLLKRGIEFLPVTLGPIRKLTSRGIRLGEVPENQGSTVIEVYPGGAQDMPVFLGNQRDGRN